MDLNKFAGNSRFLADSYELTKPIVKIRCWTSPSFLEHSSMSKHVKLSALCAAHLKANEKISPNTQISTQRALSHLVEVGGDIPLCRFPDEPEQWKTAKKNSFCRKYEAGGVDFGKFGLTKLHRSTI